MKKITLLILIISIVFTGGCWDMIEINQRLFPYSIGIDMNPGEGDPYIITISYPNIYSIGKNATQEDRVYVVSTLATSIFQGANQLATRLQYPFYFKHLRVIVLGEGLVNDGELVKQILDGINRDYVINKKVRVVSAEGTARDVLHSTVNAKRQEVLEGAIYSMLKYDDKTSRYTAKNLTDFIRDTDVGGVATMPRIAVHGEDFKIFGGCVFKDFKFVGHLEEIENRAVALVRGKVKEDLVDVAFNGTNLSYSISGTKIKRKLVEKENKLGIKIDIVVEGTLRMYIHAGTPVGRDDTLISRMENAIERHLEGEIEKVIEKLQKDLKADALGIGQYIYKYHPQVWKDIQDDWDEIFSEMDIDVEVKAFIRRRGLVQ